MNNLAENFDHVTSSNGQRHDLKISKPDPLVRKLPEPEPYPLDALGDILSPAAKRLAEVIQAPDALCGQSVLAAAALAVQARRNVVVDGREVPVSEFFLTVGESGERKSAVDKEALKAHREFEKELRDRYERDLSEFEIEKTCYEKARQEALQKAKGGVTPESLSSLGSAPEAPLSPVFIMEEPTLEGAQKLLAVGQPSMGLYSDEGGRMLGGHGMSESEALKTAAGLSEFWDGKRISRVRGGDGASLLYGRRISMHLMAQPGVIQRLTGNALLLNQGLPSRCLTAWPKSTAGKRLYKSVDLSLDPVMSRYHDRMGELIRAPLPLAEGRRNELAPTRLPLSAEAKALWIAFHDQIESQLGEGQALAPVRGFANKAPEHALRLAGILTLVSEPNAAEVRIEEATAGIDLVQYYLSEALRLFHVSQTDPDLVLAEKLLEWLKPRQFVCAPQVYQYGPNAIRDKKTAARIIDVLESHGWLIKQPGGMRIDGVHRKDVWAVWHG